MFCEFRGRMYTLNNILSYQGNDLSRALLLFAETETINEEGKEALIVYFANLAGLVKHSWNDRITEGKFNFIKY